MSVRIDKDRAKELLTDYLMDNEESIIEELSFDPRLVLSSDDEDLEIEAVEKAFRDLIYSAIDGIQKARI